MILLLITLITQERPIIRLEDILIEGTIRKPPLIELQGSDPSQTLEKAALKNLIELEKKLLTPRSPNHVF